MVGLGMVKVNPVLFGGVFTDDGRSEFDNSLVVSMEVNGIMYQGVLFAQTHHRRL